MARTKQTARKTTIQAVPRAQLIAKAKKRAGKAGSAPDDDDEEIESMSDIVNTQQFSLKFDDQEKC